MKKKKKSHAVIFVGEETIHLNNPKCAAESVLFTVDKVHSLIRSQSKPLDVVSCYVRNTSPCRRSAPSRSLGQAEGQRAERVLTTVEQRAAADSRLDSKFTGRDRGEKFPLHRNYWNR